MKDCLTSGTLEFEEHWKNSKGFITIANNKFEDGRNSRLLSCMATVVFLAGVRCCT